MGPDGFGRAYEASLPADRRRAGGIHYTPPALADEMVALALQGRAGPGVRVCDPACGAGAFLLAAGRALEARGVDRRSIATEALWGCDVDPRAVGLARAAVEAWAGVAPPADHLVVSDGLRLGERGWHSFDAVIGNPPFLNQLERATVRSGPVPAALAAVTRPYTDTAWLFLAVGCDLTAAGGRVVLIQPQSVVSARDALPVRDEVARQATLERMWTGVGRPFAARVDVCAPVLRVGRADPRHGPGYWAVMSTAASGAVEVPPPMTVPPGSPTLGDLATATAGFRSQFYGLAPYVVDRAEADDRRFPRLVTCGLVDPGSCDWGRRPARFAGRRWDAPRVDLDALPSGPLRRWVAARCSPKVVVATQTRVLEAAVDEHGTWVPSTPLIAVHPRHADRLWDIAAVVMAPPLSAWVLANHRGAALHSDAIKLSAAQVLDLPTPADEDRWRAGAVCLRAGDVLAGAEAMTRAFGAGDDVFEWWRRRAAPLTRGVPDGAI
ncbi:MAG: HsdM family class I SAM-dependent methyltransferase [Acidimicrobiia bacterium]